MWDEQQINQCLAAEISGKEAIKNLNEIKCHQTNIKHILQTAQFAYEKWFLINSLVLNGQEKIDFHHRSMESRERDTTQTALYSITFVFVFHLWSFHAIATTLNSLSLAPSLFLYLTMSHFHVFCECYWIRFWLCDATMHLLSNHFHIQSTDTLTSTNVQRATSASSMLEQQTAVQINSGSRVWIKPLKMYADDSVYSL